ncbi:MAG TPA: hypothetical protein VMC41_04360 [Candidatus Nanoarchaeia archaeon]|nr:hypothetical protein [Candidatus Nanoarchaeia archaeon]
MKRLILLVFIGLFLSFFGGCSNLMLLEHKHSMDVQDSVDGVALHGCVIARSEAQAKRQILNREVEVKKDEGFKVEVVNYSVYIHKFEIRKTSFLLENPVVYTGLLAENQTDSLYLMPGYYQMYCWEGSQLVGRKVYEVSTAKSYDGVTKREVNCIMGYIDDQRYGLSRHGYGVRRY